ncbi:MAG TPA: cation diffusion facilitator family transporter [Bryobacteraceae bacterium]|nr:cation diffusion facilitator family transporter [Bryobacteraceae bacterium]
MAALDEKRAAARSSVVASVALTALKIVVGVATGSLGILAEAAHSALDLCAALVTLFAVRMSGKPPDREHTYGHGKIENLSALVETVLLLMTCGWIIRAAAVRLIRHTADVEVTVFSFAVMVTSIVVDWSRSRVLRRTATRYNSQALEADALHFETDIWSSAVVVVGLIGVWAATRFPAVSWMRYADAVAALAVASIVIWVSMKLGLRTISALVDTAPSGLEEKILDQVRAVPGIAACDHLRLRYSGPTLFVDVRIEVDGNQSLRDAHRITEEVEIAIQRVAPDADVTVHAEPPGAHARG